MKDRRAQAATPNPEDTLSGSCQLVPTEGPSAATEDLAKRSKKRGLGDMGKLALAAGLPALTLLPHRDEFPASQVADLCQISLAMLRRWAKEIPELRPQLGTTGARAYGREQVAQIMRVKHLALIDKQPIEEVKRRLAQALPPPVRPPMALVMENRPRPSFPALPASVQGGLPAASVAFLKEELLALIELCKEGD